MCVARPGVTLTGPKPLLFSQMLWEFIWETEVKRKQINNTNTKSFQSEEVATLYNFRIKSRPSDLIRASAQQVLLLLVAEHGWRRGSRRKSWSQAEQKKTNFRLGINYRNVTNVNNTASSLNSLKLTLHLANLKSTLYGWVWEHAKHFTVAVFLGQNKSQKKIIALLKIISVFVLFF